MLAVGYLGLQGVLARLVGSSLTVGSVICDLLPRSCRAGDSNHRRWLFLITRIQGSPVASWDGHRAS